MRITCSFAFSVPDMVAFCKRTKASLALGCALFIFGIVSAPVARADCPTQPVDPDRVCGEPQGFDPNWANVLSGPNRYQSAPVDHTELRLGVFPSPDSDLAILPPGFPSLTENGQQTTVTATHPAIGTTQLPFTGLVSGFGYGWGGYAQSWLRSQYDPSSDASLAQPWEITIANPGSAGTTAVVLSTASLDPTARPGLVTDLTLTGSGTTPTISWAGSPGYVTVLLYSILPNGGIRLVDVEGLGVDATSWQIPSTFSGVPHVFPEDASLQLNQPYLGMINVTYNARGVQGEDGISRTWFEFTPVEDSQGNAGVKIPTVTIDVSGNKVFSFDFAVLEGMTYQIDPQVAVGYDYEVGATDPGFKSVTLPDIGDGEYELVLFRSNTPYRTGVKIHASDEFSFVDRLKWFGVGAQGLKKFRIIGIERSANVDPNSATAFVTGVSFVADGRFTGTQKPIAVEITQDSDQDGVADLQDVCLQTAVNVAVDAQGCSSAQRIVRACPVSSYKNRLSYVSCVASETDMQLKIGLVTLREAATILLDALRMPIAKR